MIEKLKSNKGETIIETLASILIVAVCFVMIQNAIVTSTKINNKASEENVPFKESNTTTSCNIKIVRGTLETTVTNVQCYETEGYHYYE